MSITWTSASTQTVHRRYEPYRVLAGEYVNFHKQGFLLKRSLIRREDVKELIDHMDNLLEGREPIPGIAVPSFCQSTQEKLQYWLHVHMMRRVLPVLERFLPHVEPHFGTPLVNPPRMPVSRSCGGKPMSMSILR